MIEIILSFLGGALVGGWIMHKFSVYAFRYAVAKGKIIINDIEKGGDK